MSPPVFRFQPRVEVLAGEAGELALADLALRVQRGSRPLVLSDGWPAGTSVLLFDPLPARPPRRLAGLRAFLGKLASGRGDPVPGAFHGGFAGALAYELGAAAERGLELPPDPWQLPGIVGGLFTDFLVRDERRGVTHLVLGEAPGDGRPPVRERARALRARLANPAPRVECVPRGPLRRLVSVAEHARRVRRARALIAAGEIYQANLSQRYTRAVAGEPLALYGRLRTLHPAPFAGYVRWRGGALLSGSPELLLACDEDAHGRRVRTRPIKGTSARGRTPRADRRSAAVLLASEKDRSELAMIVDLERNDLGRIAVPGGVTVEGFPTLASYASVHHLMADVVARPRAELDALACLAALYPGGSVTGAPKLRSMEVIAELEAEGRGFAYGAQLLCDLCGHLQASLLIRTLIWRPLTSPRGRARGPLAGEVSFRVGGAITWGSDPEAEEAEVQAKGERLARALEGEAPVLARSERGSERACAVDHGPRKRSALRSCSPRSPS